MVGRTIAAAAITLATFAACGSETCEEPGLRVEPNSVSRGGTITVTADPPLKACVDPATGVTRRPLPASATTVNLAVAEARIADDGTAQITGKKYLLKQVPYDARTGEFSVTETLPSGITSGQWVVFVNGASEIKTPFRVKFSG